MTATESKSQLGKARSFEDLTVWQKSHELVLKIYETTARFPRGELFGLVAQMRRAAISVPANIAEGFKKRGNKDKCNFYNIAQGSLEELRYYLVLARDLKYCEDIAGVWNLSDEVARMLTALIRSVGRGTG
jgi:four helix bundle protein